MALQFEVFEVGSDVTTVGLSFASLPPSRPVVTKVHPGSWADEQALEPGDELLSVNGRTVEQMQRTEFMQAMKSRPLALQMCRQHNEDLKNEEVKESEVTAPVVVDAMAARRVPRIWESDDAPTAVADTDMQSTTSSSEKSQRSPITSPKGKQLVVGVDVATMGCHFESLPPSRPVVAKVLPGGWAEQMGIVPGDQLLYVDGRDVREMQREEFIQVMQLRPLQLQVRMSSVKQKLSGLTPRETFGMTPRRTPRTPRTPREWSFFSWLVHFLKLNTCCNRETSW